MDSRNEVIQAANNNVQPYYAASGDLMLRTTGGRRKLMQGNKATPLGKLFFDTTGQPIPRGYNLGAVPYRIGRTELIATQTGDRMTRRWNPISSSWNYSELGKLYYNVSRQEVTIHLPITVYGQRANGKGEYTFQGHMPITNDNVDSIYRPNGDMEALKQLVLAEFQDNELYQGKRIVYEASEEIWVYNDEGSWRISTMNTNPSEGDPETAVLLQRPLGVLKTRLDHDLVIPEALEIRNDFACVPRQMAVVLEKPFEQICKEFDKIQPYWRDKGITSESILKYATEHNITTTVLYNDKLLAKYNPPDRKFRKCMTYAIDGAHALFYQNPRVMICRDPVKKIKKRTERHRSRI